MYHEKPIFFINYQVENKISATTMQHNVIMNPNIKTYFNFVSCNWREPYKSNFSYFVGHFKKQNSHYDMGFSKISAHVKRIMVKRMATILPYIKCASKGLVF